MSAAIQPYLFFPGNTEAAINFYQQVFGGELTITRRGDVEPTAPEDKKQQVINASLVGPEITIRASDREDATAEAQTRIELTVIGDDESRLRKIFDVLSQGGNVVAPLEKQFWGDIFGAFTDKFGIGWQVNIGAG